MKSEFFLLGYFKAQIHPTWTLKQNMNEIKVSRRRVRVLIK